MSGINKTNKTNATANTTGVQAKPKTAARKADVPVGESYKETKKLEAKQNIDKKLKEGTIEYHEANAFTKIFGKEDFCVIYLDGEPTLGAAKSMFNLAPGTLRSNWDGVGGGNLDVYKCPKDEDGQSYIHVDAKDLSEGANMTQAELLAKFPKNAIH